MPIYSIPSLRQPESISPQFYFTSQSFITKAKIDINLLLTTWIQSNQLTPQNQIINNNNINNNQRLKLGPFLKFKSIYSRLGWIYVHLSVVDPALRKYWFQTIIRIFLSNLITSKNSTSFSKDESWKQIGVLFALWCFWGTQPDCSELGPKHYIILDPETQNYIHQIPLKFSNQLDDYFNDLVDESYDDSSSNPIQISNLSSIKHRAHLDPSIFGPPPPIIRPSDSLHQVLKNLIDQDAFLIQPTQVALVYPPLPTTFIIFPEIHLDQNSLNNKNTTIHLDSDQNQQNNSNFSSDTAELILSTKSELSKLKKLENKSLCDSEELNQIRSNYTSSKNFLLNPQEYIKSNQQNNNENQIQIQNDNDTSLTKDLFLEAIGMTRKVIQKTGPGLDHLLFPNQPTNNTTNLNKSNDMSSLDAFFLVDNAQSVPRLNEIIENHH